VSVRFTRFENSENNVSRRQCHEISRYYGNPGEELLSSSVSRYVASLDSTRLSASWTMIWWASVERIWKRSESNYRPCRSSFASRIDSRRRRCVGFQSTWALSLFRAEPRALRQRRERMLSCPNRDALGPVYIYIYLYSSKNDSNQTNRKEQKKTKKLDSEHNIDKRSK